MIKLYKIKETDKTLKGKLFKLSAKWSPYRTYACLLPLGLERLGKK